MPYFDMRNAEPSNEYVCWLDIMGTKNKMLTSVKQSSIFIFKFHVAILEAIQALEPIRATKIIAYPVMDGVYLTSPEKDIILDVISKIFFSMAHQFTNANIFYHLYMIKGAIAYGPIYHGRNIANDASYIFENSTNAVNYKQSILLGMPMVLACQGEKDAPPFGLFVDESARNSPCPIPFKWYRWDSNYAISSSFAGIKNAFIEKVDKYYDCCTKCSASINYPLEKIQEHKALFNMYFFDPPSL